MKREEKKKQKEAEEKEKKIREEKKKKQNIRRNTRRKFEQIFKQKKAGENMEKRIYKASGSEINDAYHQKTKDLAYNLEKNKELLNKVLNGIITLKKLSTMTNEELASKDLSEERKQREEKFKKENTLKEKMVFGNVNIQHKQLLGHRDDINDDKYGRKDDGPDIDELENGASSTMITNNNKTKKSPSPTPGSILSSTPSTVCTVDSTSNKQRYDDQNEASSSSTSTPKTHSHSNSPSSPLNNSFSNNRNSNKPDTNNFDVNHHRNGHNKIPKKAPPKKKFNPKEMTQILKSCQSKKSQTNIKTFDDRPSLKIQRDSSDDDDDDMNEDEDDDVQMTILLPPPPPAEFGYGSKQSHLNDNHQDKIKRIDKSKNIWTGSVRKSSSDKPFTLSLYPIGGKDVKLKSVIPKNLQINGRLKYKDISSCLSG